MLCVPPGAEPTDSLVARWSDGLVHSVADISCDDLQTMLGGAEHKIDGAPVVWKGIHCATSHIVFVKWRQDRRLLMSLFEQSLTPARFALKCLTPTSLLRNQLPATSLRSSGRCVAKAAWQSAVSNVNTTNGRRLGHVARRVGCERLDASESVFPSSLSVCQLHSGWSRLITLDVICW